MRRRSFITLLGSAATMPLSAHAQQPGMPVIGILSGGSAEGFAVLGTAFRQGLDDVGYTEDRNVTIESRWARGEFARAA